MIKFAQIFGTILFTMAFAFVLVVVLPNSENALTTKNSVNTIDEVENSAFGAYSKMALISMKEPEKQIAMPVKGVRTKQIADTWGAARSGGRRHSGQDVFARRGTPVYSATEGYVLRIGESDLGGKHIFIYGAGGRRYYYAHMDNFAPDLKVGDYVTKDNLIGFVGSTGNAANTPPHLHFAIYGIGGAINPLTLLADRT